MPRKPAYNTLRERAELFKSMWDLAMLDCRCFAYVQPFSPDEKTPYKTRNSMVKKRPKKGREASVEIQMVELQIDLKKALLENQFEEAIACYFPLARYVGL